MTKLWVYIFVLVAACASVAGAIELHSRADATATSEFDMRVLGGHDLVCSACELSAVQISEVRVRALSTPWSASVGVTLCVCATYVLPYLCHTRVSMCVPQMMDRRREREKLDAAVAAAAAASNVAACDERNFKARHCRSAAFPSSLPAWIDALLICRVSLLAA